LINTDVRVLEALAAKFRVLTDCTFRDRFLVSRWIRREITFYSVGRRWKALYMKRISAFQAAVTNSAELPWLILTDMFGTPFHLMEYDTKAKGTTKHEEYRK
jgi:hypothetical protein